MTSQELYQMYSDGLKTITKKYFDESNSPELSTKYIETIFDRLGAGDDIKKASFSALMMIMSINLSINFIYLKDNNPLCTICNKNIETGDVCRTSNQDLLNKRGLYSACDHLFHAECICSHDVCPNCHEPIAEGFDV